MGRVRRSLGVLLGPLLLVLAATPNSTESAIANGDTRTLTLSDAHTNESGSFTYKVDGYYDSAVLEKLNWFLRDWRLNESTRWIRNSSTSFGRSIANPDRSNP